MAVWLLSASSLLLVCSALASRGFAPEYEQPSPGRASLWEEEEEEDSFPSEGRSNAWPEQEVSALTRQIFGHKEDDSSDPLLLRAELSAEEEEPAARKRQSKRESPSLSIVNPLEVLRQRLMLDLARRRMKENQDQIRENAVILKNLGKKRDDARTKQNDYFRRITQVSKSDGYQV